MTRRDERLPWLVLAAVLVAAASVRDVGGLPAWAPAALGATALLRAALDALGRRVHTISLTPAAWVFGPALVLAWVLHAARAGTPPSDAVLGVVIAATAYSTLTSAGFAGRSAGTAGALRTTGLAGATALCAAFAAPTPTTTLCLVAFVVLSVPIAATAAARFGTAAGSSGDPTVRRVRAAPGLAERPARAGVGALALLALGLPFGAALFAAFPPPPGRTRTADASARGAEAARGAAAGGVEGEDRAGEDVARTGSRTGGRSAFVASLRADPRVVLRVRVGEGERGREPLVLRGETYDLFDGRSWTRSGAADAGAEIVPPRPGGWGFVTSGASSDRVVRVSFLDVTGAPPAALPLVPEARRVRLLEGLETHRMRRRGDGAVALLAPRRPDARWEQEADVALVSREALPTLRCDRDVAPLLSYAQPPPEAAALAALASTVVGDASTAAVEAERLEAWLRGPDFRYALEVEADPRRPVADFVLRARSGHCWCFASTMTAMMRSLGRPARLALGYRGGDFLETLGEWAVRGTNAHAWCEVFYEGAGWVPYDPTPSSAETVSATGEDAGPGFLERLSRFTADDRRRLLAGATAFLRRALDLAQAHWPWLLGVAALLATAVLSSRRRAVRVLAVRDGAVAPGPYGRALAALARAGLPRGRAETPDELSRRAGRARPRVGGALGALTRVHEASRYGGVAPDADGFHRLVEDVVEGLEAADDPARTPVPPTSPAG